MAVSDSETDPGYRSRSASRRARRKKQTQGKQNMSSLPEEGQSAEANAQASSGPQSAQAQSSAQEQSSAQAQRSQAPQQAQQEVGAMQPFEYIGPDSTSMDGPVTYARAMRGEIPMRPGNPDQKLKTAGGGGEESSMMDQDGLKLRLELNLDIEVELKAKIYGDLTLALL